MERVNMMETDYINSEITVWFTVFTHSMQAALLSCVRP